MSLRSRSDRGARGGTLLEMAVALLILALIVVAMSRLIMAHSRLLDSMDVWCRGSPTLHVVPPQRPFEAECGVAASLSDAPPGAPVPPPEVTIVNDVEILSVTRTLVPPTASATVRLTPR